MKGLPKLPHYLMNYIRFSLIHRFVVNIMLILETFTFQTKVAPRNNQPFALIRNLYIANHTSCYQLEQF